MLQLLNIFFFQSKNEILIRILKMIVKIQIAFKAKCTEYDQNKWIYIYDFSAFNGNPRTIITKNVIQILRSVIFNVDILHVW